MDLPELQKILDNAPGADVDVEFFDELKTVLNSLLFASGGNAVLPVYADNNEAKAELPDGALYADNSGNVKVVQGD